ncbi:MAG: hypothetical protein KKF46_04540 [Nanoarchaeota archaeon]|nr:hypothetical protein [Nanoarchaeota archaeon]MBU1321605.1 hypothetical protein [Nanoarchaeota archaeon]MBU1598001.1 hypothetical protein [Nanoarchaeota archaeon]MBU2440951.1 hypothetical protein [Nanoarchaeota archaeon]
MYNKPVFLIAVCDYAERSEKLRGKYRKMSQDYLQGRIDQYDKGFIPNIPLVGRLFAPQEIDVMKSVLEEKIKHASL